jgi:hypothetical protein
MNLAGIDSKVNDTFISFSIGEPAISTIGTKEGYITQGFLQPEVLPCTDIKFRYYPNPAIDLIRVEADGCEVGILSIVVLDVWGRPLKTVPASLDNEVSLGDFAQGVYLLKVTLTNNDVHTISVVRSSN